MLAEMSFLSDKICENIPITFRNTNLCGIGISRRKCGDINFAPPPPSYHFWLFAAALYNIYIYLEKL